jgi:hypothetical protein
MAIKNYKGLIRMATWATGYQKLWESDKDDYLSYLGLPKLDKYIDPMDFFRENSMINS